MKKYRIRDKDRFYATIVILLIFIVGGIYISIQQISSCEAEQKDIITKETVAKSADEVEPIVTPEAIAIEVAKMPTYNIGLSEELQDFTFNCCEYLDVAYELELAILRTESNFDSTAVSYTGACRGMGQLSRTTAKGLAESLQIEDFDVYNAEHNISCSVYLVMQLRDYWRAEGYCEEDVIGLSLLSYNRGVAGCYKYIENHDIYDDNYVNIVLERKAELEQYGEFVN